MNIDSRYRRYRWIPNGRWALCCSFAATPDDSFSRSGYFPARMLREHESRGPLHRIGGAPAFRLSA
jgi:hypothetical protein